MNTAKTIAFAIATLLMVPAASANTPTNKGAKQTKAQKAQRMLDKFDRNGDHVLDARELEAMIEFREQRKAKRQNQRKAHMLERFDSNNDGQLDESERAAMRAKRAEHHDRMMQRFDSNGDGTLDPSERQVAHRTMAGERFDGLLQRFDGNKDGAIAWVEVAAKTKTKASGKRSGKASGERSGKASGNGKSHGKGEKLRKLFHKADTNNDKVLTRAEFTEAMKHLAKHRRGGRGHHMGGPGHGQSQDSDR